MVCAVTYTVVLLSPKSMAKIQSLIPVAINRVQCEKKKKVYEKDSAREKKDV